jgi:hypothetical protein
MNVRLYSPPWIKPELTLEAEEAIKILGDDIWRDASIHFAAERDAKLKAGKSAPKGMQKYINEVLVERFYSYGWEGDSGYFFKERTWVRATFRHQMSLGSDILDALKVCKIEGMELAIILAANRSTLNIISPNDAAAIISFEKLQKEILSLNGALDIPLLIGELTPLTSASKDIAEELKKARPRDVSIPVVYEVN